MIAPTLTFSATVNPILYEGARPVFIDSSRETWTMDPALLEEELAAAARRGKLPKAVIVVDLYGQCADYDPIVAACERYGVPLVEDAAEALGATYTGRAAGSFGALGVFSFNGNKIITTSGGGMLLSDRKELIEQARFLATQARDPAPHYQHSEIGFNYRLSQPAGRGGARAAPRARPASRPAPRGQRALPAALGGVPGLAFMPEAEYGARTRWLTAVTFDAGGVRRRPRGGPACAWSSATSRPARSGSRCTCSPSSPASPRAAARWQTELFERGLCLPSGSSMTDEDVVRVAAEVVATSPALALRAASAQRAPRPPAAPSPSATMEPASIGE